MQLKPQPAARARWAGAANFDYSMQKSTGGASPYPKSVIGNDEGGFARTWRTKTYSGREKGGGAKPLVTLSPQTIFRGPFRICQPEAGRPSQR